MIETDIQTLKGGVKYGNRLIYAVIYSLVNLDNGKRYIGRTHNPKQRITNHLMSVKGHYHHNALIRKDSDCRFGFEILEEVGAFIDESERERYYMMKYKTYDERYGYNVNDPVIRNTKTQKYTKAMKKHLESI